MTTLLGGGVLEESDAEAVGVTAAGGPVADWSARAGAFTVDVLFGLGVLIAAGLVALSARPQGWLWWLCVVIAAVALLAIAVNRYALPAILGWSLGRSMFGIAVVGRDGAMAGPAVLVLRDVAHVLDTVPLFSGWLWPLVDARGRTFADLVARTEVRTVVGSRPDWHKRAIAAVVAAATLAAAAAGAGYLGVYRPELGAAQAREQVAVQGPKIVAELLTYKAASIEEDFTRVQSLVTDGYRPTWVAQQEATRKTGAVDNDYWVTNSAVLNSARDRAVMLLLLQGQRGAVGSQRFISASVRVAFEKSGSGQWQVSDLTVLARPKPGGSGG
ncbi:MAG: RDD family protein [Mycobacterium sp.]